MIRINLIPEPVPAASTRVALTEIGTFAAIIMIANFAPGIYASRINDQTNMLTAETVQKQSAIEQLKTDGEVTNQFKGTISDLKFRSQKIRNLTIGRKQPVYMLDKLQQQHPDRLWLKNITLTLGELRITGFAAETELISDYAARIKALSENQTASAIDIETFTPPFADYFNTDKSEKPEEISASAESTIPLNFSELIIKRFSLSEYESIEAYDFEILVRVKMPEGV
jgi:hypothetical protein